MASKKSSSPVATSTRSPPASASPALTQSPFVSDLYKHHRRNAKTVETTPPPTSTTTQSPIHDPYEYEKSAYTTIPMTDGELELLKEHVRLLHGLPPTKEKHWRRVTTLQPPKVQPRATLTSWRRTQLQQRRMVVRCGGNLKQKFDEYERMMASSEDAALVYRRLRDDAMAQTTDQTDSLFEQQELQNLKYLAEQAKEREVVEYRDNQGSRLRFKCVRGEPIISSNFRDAYDDHTRPPFAVVRRTRQPKVYLQPKIDKRKEIWLMPVDDDDGRPLHTQPRTPDPKDKRSRQKKGARPAVKRGVQNDKGSPKDKKERRLSMGSAEPLAKKGKGSSRTESKAKNKGVRRKKPPWHFGVACPANIGWFG